MSQAGPPTLALLRQWHQGDRKALGALVARNLDWVVGHVRQRLGAELRARAETLDFVQETVLDFLEYGPRFELADEEALRALLVRVVENNLRDAHRHLHRQQRDVAREKGVATDTVLKLDPAAQPVATPSVLADRNERRAWVRLALELLEPGDRAAILLRDFDDLSFPEIGERLGIGENGARMRYQRALPKLAKKVQELRSGRLQDVLRHG